MHFRSSASSILATAMKHTLLSNDDLQTQERVCPIYSSSIVPSTVFIIKLLSDRSMMESILRGNLSELRIEGPDKKRRRKTRTCLFPPELSDHSLSS